MYYRNPYTEYISYVPNMCYTYLYNPYMVHNNGEVVLIGSDGIKVSFPSIFKGVSEFIKEMREASPGTEEEPLPVPFLSNELELLKELIRCLHNSFMMKI